MNKRARELARQEGISYMQALQKMHPQKGRTQKGRTQKPALSPEQQAWQDLKAYADELGFEVKRDQEAYALMGFGVAYTGAMTLESIAGGQAWLEEYADANFEA